MFCACGNCTYEDHLRKMKFTRAIVDYKNEQEQKLKTKSPTELFEEVHSSGSHKKKMEEIFLSCGFTEETRAEFNSLLGFSFQLFSMGLTLDVEGMEKEFNKFKQENLN